MCRLSNGRSEWRRVRFSWRPEVRVDICFRPSRSRMNWWRAAGRSASRHRWPRRAHFRAVFQRQPRTAFRRPRSGAAIRSRCFARSGRIWRGVREASAVIQRIGAKAVVGFGGYPTLPPLYAATRRGVPTMVHEANIVMGRASKALARRVDVIAGGFLTEQASGHPEKYVFTGNPVRQPSSTCWMSPMSRRRRATRFACWCSAATGRAIFSDAIPAAIRLLPEADRKRLKLTQQVRAEDVDQSGRPMRRLASTRNWLRSSATWPSCLPPRIWSFRAPAPRP